MPLTVDRSAYRFFLDNGGYIVGERAKGALTLARAEAAYQLAKDDTARMVWEEDPNPDTSWMTQRERYDWLDGTTALMMLTLQVKCECCGQWQTVDSLGGIHLRSNDPYMRVCEAEMYANYLDDLERKED